MEQYPRNTGYNGEWKRLSPYNGANRLVTQMTQENLNVIFQQIKRNVNNLL